MADREHAATARVEALAHLVQVQGRAAASGRAPAPDRPVTPADADAFREKLVEVVETAEEPVVAKEAVVVEEIVVHKDVAERVETVRDTVRRTAVEVEQDPATGTPGTRTPPARG